MQRNLSAVNSAYGGVVGMNYTNFDVKNRGTIKIPKSLQQNNSAEEI